MKKILLISLLLMITLLQQVTAQSRSISGRITDRTTGEGIPGVTVLVKGTTNGVSTNSDGTYVVSNTPVSGGTLVFSSIGYTTIERPIGSEDRINVALANDTKQLNEVVVTSLGIEKDKRSLGYATQEIQADQISQKSEPNLLNTLQGKVAGVSITNSSGLPGASTNINIRGITSLQGNNQPLFVVDGIPISNDLDRTGNSLFAAQTPNRALDIDPENVASMTILKGPAAAALYGSRASSGAIIITTKSGRNVKNKTEVVITSSLNFQNVYGLADLQNEYGQGNGGVNVLTNGDPNTGTSNSWGPRFGTTPTLANGLLLADGSTLPYQAYPDNINDFYKTGRILTNGANISGGNIDQNASLNINNTDQKGITDRSYLKRTSVQLAGNTKLMNKLRAGGSVNFIQTTQLGPVQGNGGSAFAQILNVPRSYNLQGLPYITPTGGNVFFPGIENPRWSIEQNPTTTNTTRFVNVATLGYKITPWLDVFYRAGLDTYTDRRKQIYSVGSTRAAAGQVLDQSVYRSEINGDLLVTLNKENIFTEGLNATLLLGQNINQRRVQTIQSQADNLVLPNFYNSSNATTYSNGTGESNSIRRLLGYYGNLDLAWRNYLFLTLTGRADQSSTLPRSNNTFFYPSATLAFVFTDAFKITNDYFSYGKIRGNVARVGRDASPYSLNTIYSVAGQGNNVASINFPFNINNINYAGFDLSNSLGGGQTLTPEFTNSFEAGTNLGFFNNRLSLDLTYFKTVSQEQIVAISTPGSTGFTTRVTNVGRLDNQGIEGLANIVPIRTTNFRWDVTANYTRIRNEVKSIAPGVTEAAITGGAFIGSTPSIVVGQPYGVIRASKNPRVTDASSPYFNQYIINPATGTFGPAVTNQVIANPNYRWQGGITNSFSYRGFIASFLVDTNQGGQVLSFTQATLKARGALEETAVDREAPRIIPGVIANGDGTYRPNNIQLDAQTYWGALSGLQNEVNVYDATVVRLREFTIGYTVPKALLERTPFGQASITFTGRNLFYYAPNANFDPEVNTQGAGNIRGLDLQGAPNTRNYGVNLRFSL